MPPKHPTADTSHRIMVCGVLCVIAASFNPTRSNARSCRSWRRSTITSGPSFVAGGLRHRTPTVHTILRPHKHRWMRCGPHTSVVFELWPGNQGLRRASLVTCIRSWSRSPVTGRGTFSFSCHGRSNPLERAPTAACENHPPCTLSSVPLVGPGGSMTRHRCGKRGSALVPAGHRVSTR